MELPCVMFIRGILNVVVCDACMMNAGNMDMIVQLLPSEDNLFSLKSI